LKTVPTSKSLKEVEEPLAILVVEDDPVYAQFIGGALRDAGHDVDIVATGAKAREKAASINPDAIMLDLSLPDEDGYDLARALRKSLPPASIIIVLTANLHPQHDLADAVGIDLVLTKPVEPAVVIGIVDLVRDRRRRKLAVR
jgi:DNA-binding response OmpR family regulator